MLVKNRAFYVICDAAAILISVILAVFARDSVMDSRIQGDIPMIALMLEVVYVAVILFYQPRSTIFKRNYWNEFRVVATINLYMALITSALLYLLKVTNEVPRSFYLVFFCFNVIWMYLGRVTLKRMIAMYYSSPSHKKRLLICTNESNALKVLRKFTNSQLYEYEVAGVAVLGSSAENGLMNTKVYEIHRRQIGTYMECSSEPLEHYLRHQVIDEALLSLPETDRRTLGRFVERLETLGIQANVAINTFGLSQKEKAVRGFGVYHVLTYSPRIFEPTELFLKRAMDIAGGLTGCLCTLILFLFIAPAIRLESPGKVIFKQTRVGKNGRRFSIYKFRSMYADAEARKKELMAKNEMDGLMFKMKDDPRITRVGRFLRRTSLDEFPQFFNVLRGDMSLVGTRPPTEEEFLQYDERHKRRLSLKPGITGMWQVRGRSAVTDFEEVVKLDLEYIDNWSVWLDIRLLLETIVVVVTGKGAE